jgi:hypothetical protein
LRQNSEIPGCKVSRSLIYRAITDHALKPHRNKYFLNIFDPDFFPKMQHIIDLYMNPPRYLFNFDECTGIQAKGALYPDLPVKSNTPHYEEFDYSRNGRTDLMVFYDANSGKVFGDCFSNHNTDTFIALFKRHVQIFSEESKLHYVMDNLSTHYTNKFCQVVAKLSGVNYSPLKTGEERRKWLQSDDKRIVIHFTPFHGSWLNKVEIWFGIFNQKCLKQKRFNAVNPLTTQIRTFMDTWNEYFAHPFSWNYTGKGLHEKVVSRFNTLLAISSNQVSISFLINQLQLIINIYNQYPEILKTQEWADFLKLFELKTVYIQNIILSSGKPRQIKKAREVYHNLCEILNCQNKYQNF